MPTYEYRCKDCGRHLEVVQSFSDEPLTECPHCQGQLKKVFGNIGIAFKGSGFYKTDSRSGASSSSSSSEGSDTKSSPSVSEGSDAKSSSDTKSSDTKSSDTKSSDTKSSSPPKSTDSTSSAPAKTA